MNTQLRVLIVEDSESDARLSARQLQRAGYALEYERVETAQEMQTALATQDWDLVIADFNLPRFSGPAALETLKERGLDIPFIVVSATIGEENAVAMMKSGAHDYIMKNNLARLAPAVERELQEAAGRRERRQAEAALVKSEATMSTILKGSPSGIGLVVYRVFQWVNDKLLNLTGYTQEELIGQKSRILYFSEAEYKRVGNVTGAQIQENGWGDVETQWRRKDGSRMEIYVTTVAVDPHDLSTGVVFTAMDITARKRAEEELRQSEQQYRLLVNNIPGFVFKGYADYTVEFFDDKIERLTGYAKEEFNAKRLKWSEILIQEDLQNARKIFIQALKGDQQYIREYRIKKQGGEIAWIQERGQIRKRQGGEIDYISGIFFDITAPKRMQEERGLLFNLSIDMLCIAGFDGFFKQVNPAWSKTLGWTESELLSKPWLAFVHPEDHDATIAAGAQLTAGKSLTSFENRYQCQDGSYRWISWNSTPFPQESLMFAVARDVTAHKQAEEKILLTAQKWRSTFDAMRDAVCLFDGDCRFTQCNQAMADLLEKPFSEIIGRPCWEVVYGESAPIEECPVIRMKESRHRETLTWLKGDRWWHLVVDPILNETGEVAGGVYIIADITMRKRSQDKVQDLNILLRVIKDINEALLRVKSERELFQQTCDLLLNVPYVRFTWIGLVTPDSFEVKPVVWAGVEEGYLSAITVKWDNSEFGQGPTGEGLRTGKPVLRGCIATDPDPNPWREEALKRGYQSSITLPLIHEREVIGILKVYSAESDAFMDEEIDFLNQVAGDIAMGVKSMRLEQELVQGVIKLQTMIHQTVETMGSIVETRDPYTAGHQQGVAHLAGAIAAEMSLDADRLQGLRVAGLLHDIGKMLVPAEILSKPGKLSEIEFHLIKIHSQVGADILGKINFPWPVAQIVLQHHERLNGSGYPAGLANPDILLEAKILAVADVVEAMSSYRPYRPALGIDQALDEITRNKGILYDSEVVDACLTLFTEGKFIFDT